MKKRMIILLQIIIAIVLVGTSVYAAVNATLDLKVSSNTVEKGDEITVTLSLKDVDSEKKVKSISGYINYNKNIIEELTVDSIVKDEDNTVKIGNETLNVEDLTNTTIDDMPDTSAYVGFNASPTSDNDIRIVMDFSKGLTEDTDLITVKFKVKSNASLGEVENAIEYKMFVITAGSNETSEEISENVTLTITNVGESGNNNNNGNQNNVNNTNNNNKNTSTNTSKNTIKNTNTSKNTNTNTNKNTSTNTNTNKNTSKNTAGGSTTNNGVDNTTSGTILPATGAKAVIIPAIILILCAYIFYNRYMKYRQI